MILLGWRLDKTLNYLARRFHVRSSPVEFVALDEFFDDSERCSMKVAELFRLLDAIDAIRDRAVYSRPLNIFPAEDERSPLLQSVICRLNELPAALICNRPNSIASNFSKLVHLQRYRSVLTRNSVRTPHTILTNEIDELECAARAGGFIVKGASAKKSICTFLTAAHIERARGEPVIGLIQEYVPGVDVRVHLTAEGVSAEGIITEEADYRFAAQKSAFPVTLPQRIEECCSEILSYEGIVFAGIDFRVHPSGEWYFLEANSSPAFQGFDIRAGGRISDLLISWSERVTSGAHLG